MKVSVKKNRKYGILPVNGPSFLKLPTTMIILLAPWSLEGEMDPSMVHAVLEALLLVQHNHEPWSNVWSRYPNTGAPSGPNSGRAGKNLII